MSKRSTSLLMILWDTHGRRSHVLCSPKLTVYRASRAKTQEEHVQRDLTMEGSWADPPAIPKGWTYVAELDHISVTWSRFARKCREISLAIRPYYGAVGNPCSPGAFAFKTTILPWRCCTSDRWFTLIVLWLIKGIAWPVHWCIS